MKIQQNNSGKIKEGQSQGQNSRNVRDGKENSNATIFKNDASSATSKKSGRTDRTEQERYDSQEADNKADIKTVVTIFDADNNGLLNNSEYKTALEYFSLQAEERNDDTKSQDEREQQTDKHEDDAIRDIQQTIINQYAHLKETDGTNLSFEEFITGSLNANEFISYFDADISTQEAQELISTFITSTIEFAKSSDIEGSDDSLDENIFPDKESGKKDYEGYVKQIQEAFYGGLFGIGTDEKAFEELINNEELNGEDWAKIITIFKSETNKSLIGAINGEYGTIFDTSANNEIMEKLASKLISSIEEDNEEVLNVACDLLCDTLENGDNPKNNTDKSKKFAESLLLNSSDKACALIMNKYKELTNSTLIKDIKSSGFPDANTDLLVFKLRNADIYDIQKTAGNMLTPELDTENYPIEDQNKAWTINILTKELNSYISQLTAQNDEDGAVSNVFNMAKSLTHLGVSSSDVIFSLEEQVGMIQELTAALNGEINLSFEDVFKRLTGVEYDEDKIIKYQDDLINCQVAYLELTSAQSFQDKISKADNLQGVYDAFCQYYGDDTAQEKMLEYLKENMTNRENGAYQAFGNPVEINFNDEGQLVVVRALNDLSRTTSDEDLECETTVYDLAQTTNMIKTMPRFFGNEKSLSDAIENTEEKQAVYRASKSDAIGKADEFEETINKYCASQDGFADKLAQMSQITGMGLIVAGGAVSFVCPPAGLTLLNIGKYASISGMFSDNALELIDNLTSKNGLSKEEGLEFVKSTLQEILLLYSGYKINSVAYGAKEIVLTASQSEVLSFLTEIGTDATLSLMCDYAITGEVDFSGEGMSQLLGIISGIAGAKINAYNKECFDNANLYLKNNDTDGAYEYLKSKGYTNKQIYKQFADTEIEKLVKYYTETGDYENALLKLEQSKILQSDYASAERQLLNDCQNVQRAKILEMIKSGADNTTIEQCIKNTEILTKSDIEYLNLNREGAQLLSKLEKAYGDEYCEYTFLYKNVDFATQQGRMILHDLELIYEAKIHGFDVNNLMVKTLLPESNIANVELGEVFVFNDKLCIRTDSPEGWQELNISKEKYCELFPVVDRFASYQGSSGDCYLVSALNAMMANPRGRLQLLSCLTENPDGSVTVKLPDSKSEITIADGKDITSLGVDPYKCMKGSLGMQLLEYAYKVELYAKKKGVSYKYKNIEKSGGNGGSSSQVFKAFGLNSQALLKKRSITNFINSIIANPKLRSCYVFTAGTNSNFLHPFAKMDPNLADNHAYGFEIIFENGEPLIKVTNPWGAEASKPQMVTLTIKEFERCFNELVIAKLI